MSRKYGKLFQVNKTKKESQDNHEIRVEADKRTAVTRVRNGVTRKLKTSDL
jgi:hypothetical protein